MPEGFISAVGVCRSPDEQSKNCPLVIKQIRLRTIEIAAIKCPLVPDFIIHLRSIKITKVSLSSLVKQCTKLMQVLKDDSILPTKRLTTCFPYNKVYVSSHWLSNDGIYIQREATDFGALVQ